MDVRLDEQQRDLQQRAREWLASAPVPTLSGPLEERFAAQRDWQRTLYDAGWIGFGWPEEHGGRGGDALDQVIFNQEMARAKAPPPAGLIGLEVVGPTILHEGDERQRSELIPALLRGDDIWCQGFSEPDAGSDLASLRTRARRVEDGWRVSGQKVWTSWAQFADRIAILARTDPDAAKHRGISYLLTEMDQPGITVRPLVQITGDAEFNEVFLDDAHVPEDGVLGGVDDGWRVTMTTLSFERGPFSLRRQVEFRVALDDLARDVASTTTHGASDRDLARALGACEVLVETMGAHGFDTATRIATGQLGASTSLDKLLMVEVEQGLFGTALDLLGPERVTPELANLGDADRWVRDYLYGRAVSVYGGSSEIQRSIVADRVLALPKDAS